MSRYDFPEPRGEPASIEDSISSHSPGEDPMTTRRREANRLAAQRFRSRKKGYQDSLEEKVRILEDEKEVLLNRIDDLVRRDRIFPSIPSNTDVEAKLEPSYPRHDTERSPDRFYPTNKNGEIELKMRFSSLESVNRSLTDELKLVHQENEALRTELDRWRHRDMEREMSSLGRDLGRAVCPSSCSDIDLLTAMLAAL
ncbi:hypothetical protein P7C73_g1825, partial [Tremellales sp. Uapishka_1]